MSLCLPHAPTQAERSKSSLTAALHRSGAAAAAAGVVGTAAAAAGEGPGPALQGLELSLCWLLLRPGMGAVEVEALFAR